MKKLVVTSIILGFWLVGAVWYTTGCLSVSLVGGRHENITQVTFGGDADAQSAMTAPSETTDFLQDFFKDNTLVPPGGEIPFPVSPKIPVTPKEPEAETPSTEVPSTENETFLWKPRATVKQPDGTEANTGDLVVLTPSSLDLSQVAANGVVLRYANRGNGNRQHWRGTEPGGSFSSPVTIIGEGKDGTLHTWMVPDSGTRFEE